MSRVTGPHLATELVVGEKVTFRDTPGLLRVVLAPYPDAAAAARDLPRRC